MNLSDTIQRLRGLFKRDQTPEEPPREIRDKHLESLEREWKYYENQRRKEHLKKALLELKKKQIRDHVFGIVKQRKKEQTILDAKLEDSGVDVTKEKFNLMKCKKLFR